MCAITWVTISSVMFTWRYDNRSATTASKHSEINDGPCKSCRLTNLPNRTKIDPGIEEFLPNKFGHLIDASLRLFFNVFYIFSRVLHNSYKLLCRSVRPSSVSFFWLLVILRLIHSVLSILIWICWIFLFFLVYPAAFCTGFFENILNFRLFILLSCQISFNVLT